MERDNVEVNIDGSPPFGWLVGPLSEGLRPQLRMKWLGQVHRRFTAATELHRLRQLVSDPGGRNLRPSSVREG